MLKTTDLAYAYNDTNSFYFPDLDCGQNDTLLILGKSGVGKSTLLHLLAGLMQPQKGDIRINDTSLGKLSNKERDQFRGKHIGIVFQKNHFISSLSVIENLLFAQYSAGREENKKKCQELLERLDIGRKSDSKIEQLSQGEKQRVAIARALVNDPSVILADEPTSALDDYNCKAVVDILQEQSKNSGAALIIVTHDSRLKDVIEKRVILS